MGNWAGRAVLAAMFWTLLGLIFTLSMFAMSGWMGSLLLSLSQWWSWGLMAPLIFAIDRRLPFTDKQLARRVFAFLLISPLLTVVYVYLFAVARAVLHVVPWSYIQVSKHFAQQELGWFLWSGLIYWMIVGALQAFRYYERYLSSELRLERLERKFSEARLNALRMQLDPHFLFNALNTISSHVECDPKLTRRMIEHLGDLLRKSLETQDRQEVPLNEEIEALNHYLAIQKIRFGEKLRIEMQIEPELRFAAVPSLILQPLVENAIRHGISHRASGGSVIVSARKIHDQIEIRVQDDGVGLRPGWRPEFSSGLGLSVTRERIKGLHPNGKSNFAVRPQPNGGTVAEIILPLRVHGGDVDDHR